MSGEPKTHTPEQGPESAAATILRHLQAGPATVMELMDRIYGDETRPKVGEYGWRIITTHLVADTLSAVDALGALMGHQFLTRDERGAVALTLPEGVRVVARDEAAELRAATTRLLAALDARDHFIEREEELPHDEWDIAFRRTGDDITNALAVLRRLAGGENEK